LPALPQNSRVRVVDPERKRDGVTEEFQAAGQVVVVSEPSDENNERNDDKRCAPGSSASGNTASHHAALACAFMRNRFRNGALRIVFRLGGT
jgi:hypothetical protein